MKSFKFEYHLIHYRIDDVEDGSALRRGVPGNLPPTTKLKFLCINYSLIVAHKIYGIPTTINSANYVYFKALQKTLELGHPDAVSVFTEELLQLHRGQGMEIYWRDSNICPTEAEYLEMVGNSKNTTKPRSGITHVCVISFKSVFSLYSSASRNWWSTAIGRQIDATSLCY